MQKRAIIRLGIILTLLLLSAALMMGCTDEPEVPENPVQALIDENISSFESASKPHLAELGADATVRFEAGVHELFYIYTFGTGHSVDELEEFVRSFLDLPDNINMYESLAGELADFMEIDTLLLTLRYYDGQGNYITSESYASQ